MTTVKPNLKSPLRNLSTVSTSSNSNLSQADDAAWSTYITNLYKQPEAKFRPKKGHDQTLKSSLDLHGMTIQQAFHAIRQFLEEHRLNGSKSAIVITGKGGKIADEFPLWVENLGIVRTCEPITDSVGECGAYVMYLYVR